MPCGAGCYGASVASDARAEGRRSRRAARQRDDEVARADAATVAACRRIADRGARDARVPSAATASPCATGSRPDRGNRCSPAGRSSRRTGSRTRSKNGSSAVIIGDRRWDKLPGGKWEESAQTPIHQPTPFWQSWTNAHLPRRRRSRRWHVSFFDPKTPGWYELLDRQGHDARPRAADARHGAFHARGLQPLQRACHGQAT